MNAQGLRVAVVAVVVLALGLLTGCGPSTAELQARELARIQAEQLEQARQEAVRAQAEARAKRLLDAEAAGDAAARAGNIEDALAQYGKVLQETGAADADDFRIRQKAIALVHSLPVAPAIPDEAMRHGVRGRTMFRNAVAGNYDSAVEELRRAVTVAPWWGDGYAALAVAQEANRQYPEAIQSLKLQMAAQPDSPDIPALKTRLYELEVAAEDAARIASLTGQWLDQDGRPVTVRIANGNKLTMTANYGYPLAVEADLTGNAFQGFAVKSTYSYDYCTIPGETNPASGRIADDGSSIEFEFTHSFYQTAKRWVGLCCGLYECTGVTLLEKRSAKIQLKKPAAPPAAAAAVPAAPTANRGQSLLNRVSTEP